MKDGLRVQVISQWFETLCIIVLLLRLQNTGRFANVVVVIIATYVDKMISGFEDTIVITRNYVRPVSMQLNEHTQQRQF